MGYKCPGDTGEEKKKKKTYCPLSFFLLFFFYLSKTLKHGNETQKTVSLHSCVGQRGQTFVQGIRLFVPAEEDSRTGERKTSRPAGGVS